MSVLMSSRVRSVIFVVTFLQFISFSRLAYGEMPVDTYETSNSPLILAPGRSHVWTPRSSGPVSVSNGATVQVRALANRSVQITGKKPGPSVLRVGQQKLEVRVVNESTYLLHQKLSQALSEIRGLTLDLDDQTLVVRGRLLRWEDWTTLAQSARGTSAPGKDPLPTRYRFEADMNPALVEKARRHFYLRFHESNLPELSLEMQPAATVALPLEPEDLQERAMRVLAPYGFTAEKSSGHLSMEPMVRVRIIVAEFNKTHARQLGLQWPSIVNAQLVPRFEVPSPEELSLGIQALEAQGLGKVLASPTLLCRSGKEAQFLAGGEIPIKILTPRIQDVIWKKYGVLLRIRPKANHSGRMSIGIETEVSMIDSAHSVDGIPGLLSNRIETHFDLKSSRTIALSGLIKKEWGESKSGLPALSSLPILGPLFASQNYRENRSELVIFVTPEIAQPETEGQP